MRSTFYILLLLSLSACLHEDPEAIEPGSNTDLDTWKHIGAADGFPGGNVKDIYYDGLTYWAATHTGLVYFDGQGFQLFTKADVLVHSNVTSIAKDSNGDLWFGTLGGANVWDGIQWFSIPNLSGFQWQILTMEQQQNGDLLLGTTGGGIIIYDGDGFFSLYDENCNECNFINTLFEDSKGNIWVGSGTDLKQYDSDLSLIKAYSTELAGSEVISIYEDFRGWIWVGYNDTNKINRIVNDKISDITLKADFETTQVYGFVDGPDNELWIGTLVSDLLYFDGVVTRTIFDGPGTDHKIFCLKSVENKISIGTDDGIYIYALP